MSRCEVRLFIGRVFHLEEPRDMRFNVEKCIDYRSRLEKKMIGVRVCGMCIQPCPIGRSGAANP